MKSTVNGFSMAYDDAGQGKPVVFVHGFPLARGAWRHQVAGLATAHRVIAPDLRGFGESAAVPGVATMDQLADDVRALMTTLTTGPAVIAGHSMGGYVALAFARKFPELVRGLVLVGTKPGPDAPEAAAGRRATAEKVRMQGTSVVIEAMAPKMIAPANAALDGEVRAMMALARPDGVVAALLGMADRPDATPILSGLRIPVLVITGADDVLIPPAESTKMAATIPGAALEIIPGAGHLVAHERPEVFNKILVKWLEKNTI